MFLHICKGNTQQHSSSWVQRVAEIHAHAFTHGTHFAKYNSRRDFALFVDYVVGMLHLPHSREDASMLETPHSSSGDENVSHLQENRGYDHSELAKREIRHTRDTQP